MKGILIYFLTLFVINFSLKAQDIVINEIMASNSYTIQDEDGDYEDWIELYNVSNATINLENYTISDDEDNLQRWTFPSVEIPPNGFLLIFASGKDRHIGSYLHTNFSISSSGEPIILSNANGVIIDEYPATEMLPNQSFGRINQGMYPLLLFETPTPGFQNADDYFYPSNIQPIFSKPSGFYKQAINLELQSENSLYTIRYTLNGSDPTINDLEYSDVIMIDDNKAPILSFIPTTSITAFHWFDWKEPKGNIDVATVVKARYFYNDIPVGNASVATYFIGEKFEDYKLPIFSIVTDSSGFFDYERGIYVGGKIGDESDGDFWGDGNFRQRGREWERKAHISYFEDKNLILYQTAGVRIHGNASAVLPIKSLRLYARNSYGKSTFNHSFFSDLGVQDFNRIMLRNSGQDFNQTYIKDALTHEIIKHLDIEIQHYHPVVVFLNGEFWGIHNMRERIDMYYFQYRKNVEDIDVIKYFVEPDIGTRTHYDNFLESFLNLEIETDAAFNFFAENIEVENYIDYMISKIYFGVYDWPGNNLRLWRERKPTGKYRFVFYDNDDAFKDYEFNAIEHATKVDGEGWPYPPYSTVLFRTILKNDNFKKLFLERFEYHLNHTFTQERVIEFCHTLQRGIEPYMQKHIERWRYPEDMNQWYSEIEKIHEFALKRPCYLKNQLIQFFDIEDSNYLRDVSTDCSTNVFADLFINPNPVIDEFSVRFVLKENVEEDINLAIVSSDGKVVYQSSFKGTRGVNFKDIPLGNTLQKGVYFIHIYNSKKNALSSKFIKY